MVSCFNREHRSHHQLVVAFSSKRDREQRWLFHREKASAAAKKDDEVEPFHQKRVKQAIMRAQKNFLLLLAIGNPGCAFGFQELSSLVVNPALLADWWYTASTAAAASSPSLDEVCFTVANLLDPSSRPQQRPFPLRVPVVKEGWSPKIFAPPSYQSTSRTKDADYYQYDYDTQPISSTLVLTPEEQDLFHLVRDVRDQYCPDTTIRIAGGWVRDKLLYNGESSSSPRDIDFVLSDKSGSDFAQLFYDSLIERGLIHPDDCEQAYKGYGSSQSQHLQTASIQFRGFTIDFCNLRFEKYSRNSRVPEKTGIASVVQDAWRRDLTINSLFYNVNTNQVEDWTEQGLHDLEFRNIATPQQPLATLLEDPLRILRAIRFAAQLSFHMDPALKAAALDPRVRHALRQKVSRQRMGNEMDAVFRTNNPTRGVELLLETDLMDVVFPLKSDKDGGTEVAPSGIYKAGLQRLSRTQALVSRIFVRAEQWDESRRRLLWYAAFFQPFVSGDASRQERGLSKRSRRDGSIFYQLLTIGLKRPAGDAQSVEKIIKGTETLRNFLEKHDEELTRQSLQLQTDVCSETLSEDDPHWRYLANLRWEGYKILKRTGPLWRESLILSLTSSKDDEDVSDAVQRYRQWVSVVEDRLGLDDCIFDDKNYSKPLLNGSQIQQRALPGVHGENFKRIMEAQEEWQLRNFCWGALDDDTDRSNREAALIDYLVHTFPEYT